MPVAELSAVMSPTVSVQNLGHFLVMIMYMMHSLCNRLSTSVCPSSGLTLAGCQVPTKATLSLPLLNGTGERK